MNKQRYVLIMGVVFPWEGKAPFVRSGKSVLGAIEYDKEADKLKCHECGDWFESLARHLKAHHLTAREYKEAHQLYYSTSLISPSLRRRCADRQRGNSKALLGLLSTRGTRRRGPRQQRVPSSELHNLNGTCLAQLPDKLKALYKLLGATPSSTEFIAAYGSVSFSAIDRRFGSYNNLILHCGLPARSVGGQWIDKTTLINSLIDFRVLNGRAPKYFDAKRKRLPFHAETYTRAFGSWPNAIFKAGLLNVAHEQEAA